MKVLERLLGQRRLVGVAALLLAGMGAIFWFTMIRQEDPTMPPYWGQIVVAFPGADAEMVERLVLEPIEDQLGEVEQIHSIDSTAYADVAVLSIELRQDTSDFEIAWEDVSDALAEARREFPEGVLEPELNDDMTGQESIVLALDGSDDPMTLLAAARRLRHELLGVRDVSRVTIVADPGEQITVSIDDSQARRLGLSAPQLVAQLSARSRILPGGSLSLGGRSVRLRPLSELSSVEEIASTPVALPDGGSVPLNSVATLKYGPAEPARSRMRVNGEPVIGLGIIPRRNVNTVDFGSHCRERIAEIAPEIAPVRVREIIYQPAFVSSRLSQLGRSLLAGILVVAGMVIAIMGMRLGLVVASAVPLVAAASLAIYAMGGGVLHQISIAALVLALGMLVDNAIVVGENVQYRLDHGATPRDASLGAVRELAVPLAGATGTTLAAFVPMLLSGGPTAEFTRAIPVLLILTLTVSYVFAVFVTPVSSEIFLRPGRARSSERLEALGRRLASLASRRTGRVLAAAIVIVTLSFMAGGAVKQQFFPSSDRNQITVDLRLAEGTHIDVTDDTSKRLEAALLKRSDVATVTSYVGRSAPHFYYNLPLIPWSPHYAQLVIDTRDTTDLDPLLDWIREFVRRELPQAEVVARKLEQGPLINAPVEIRIFGRELRDLYSVATEVAKHVRSAPGATDVRHTVTPGSPTIQLTVDDATAARSGATRADVALALYGTTRGLPVGEMRSGEDPVPIVVRASRGENTPAEDLAAIPVPGAGATRPVPLAQITKTEASWRPAVVQHRDRKRVVHVLSQLRGGVTYGEVLEYLRPRIAAMKLPRGVAISYGGEEEGSGEASSSLMRAVPIGILLLIGALLAEFNSFRRVGIILVTVPLAAAGVIPGLLIGDQPFGFMSTLGVVALVGVVVNNAILLLEVIEAKRTDGATIDEAISDAVVRRIRPILLTSGTTVVGMLPLAFSQSTLWPPLAWAMITGLSASTLLTLVVIPALYKVIFGGLRSLRPAAAVTLLLATGLLGGELSADEPSAVLTVHDAMRRTTTQSAVAAAEQRALAADRAAVAERRAALLPFGGVGASVSRRDRDQTLETPIGAFVFGAATQTNAGVSITQPLLDPAQLFYGAPAARFEAVAADHSADRTRHLQAAIAGEAVLDILALHARLDATRAFAESLDSRLREVEAMVAAGRALEADALKVRLALDTARQEERTTDQLISVARAQIERLTGISGDWIPAAPGDPDDPNPPDPVAESALALSKRDDLKALRSAIDALEKRRGQVHAESLPKISAIGRWSWSSGSPYAESSWLEGSVQFVWNPLASGTRIARAEALSHQIAALRAELQDAERGVLVELRSASAALSTSIGELAVGESGVRHAEETLRVERERHLAGRSTTNDLLDAEAALREQRTRRDVARLNIERARIRYALAAGDDPLDVIQQDRS